MSRLARVGRCPHCGSYGAVAEQVYTDTIRGKTVTGLRINKCEACGLEHMTAEQIEANEAILFPETENTG